jgi:hypothetical protein
MKKLLAFAALFLFPVVLWAAAKSLKATETIEIAAPPDAVWAKVKDFNGLNNWHPAVKKAEIVEGENNKKGAVRVLTLGDGGTIKETLLAYDNKELQVQHRRRRAAGFPLRLHGQNEAEARWRLDRDLDRQLQAKKYGRRSTKGSGRQDRGGHDHECL